MAMSTGGAHSSTKSNRETSATDEVPAELATDDSTLPKLVADSTAIKAPVGRPKGGADREQQRVDHPTGAPGVQATTLTATRNALPSRPKVLPPPRTVVDVAIQQPVTAVVATPRQQANFPAAQVISTARTEPTEPPSTVSAVVLAALATAVLGPLAPDGPPTPVDSPLELALLAVGARPRPFGQPAIEETRSLPVGSALTGQSVDGEQAFAVAAMAAAVNSAPNAPEQPCGVSGHR
jgi:hypothetical protein